MIGVIAQNAALEKALVDGLADFEATPATKVGKTYDLVVIAQPQAWVDAFFKNNPAYPTPVILLGATHEEADSEIRTPVILAQLRQNVQKALLQLNQLPTFENAVFSFQPKHRLLIRKADSVEIHLTEKENALLVYLVRQQPRIIPREELLTAVWRYRPDSQTHTVESHIYALRHKIGTDADSLFRTTDDGYQIA